MSAGVLFAGGCALHAIPLQVAEAGKCSLMLYLMIPQSYVLQILVFHDPMTFWGNLGMAMIICACICNALVTVLGGLTAQGRGLLSADKSGGPYSKYIMITPYDPDMAKSPYGELLDESFGSFPVSTQESPQSGPGFAFPSACG